MNRFFAIIFLFLISGCKPSVLSFSGDGKFYDNGFFSMENRYQVYLETFLLSGNREVIEYNISGLPERSFSLLLDFEIVELDNECPDRIYSPSHNQSERLNDLLRDYGLTVGIKIFENGKENLIIKESYLNPDNRKYGNKNGYWDLYNRGRYRHSLISHGQIKLKRDAVYEIHVSIDSKTDLPNKLCVQPYLFGGTSWAI